MRTPINVDSDAQGNLYVTDTEREQVLIYGPDRTPLEPIGRKDEMKPCGLAVVGEELYITDLKHHQVRVYRLRDRALIRTIPRSDDDGKGRLYSPTNVAVDRQGRVYVADPGAFCVQVYDTEGKFLRTLGRQGIGPGRFARPRGLAVDHEGRVYIVDAATQVVQLFDNEGRLLIFFGDPTITGPGATSLPAGVAVDYENVRYFQKFVAPGHQLEYVVLLTNQYGDPKISAYGFLRKR
jgi:DNA-binding beta-propeller fold protein YncE